MSDPSVQPNINRRLKRIAAKKYPPQFISELAKEFEISKRADVAVLKKVLRLAAHVYLVQRNDKSHEPKIREQSTELSIINKRAQELENALACLSGPVSDLFWAPLRYVPSEYTLNSEISEYFGYPVTRHTIDPTKKTINFPKEGQIQKAVHLISNLADHALRRLVPDKGGRPTSEALRIWVVNMQRFWEKQLGRPFTHYQHNQTPVSSAFLFCQRTLRPLDGSISTILLGTTIRAVIKETPKSLRLKKSRKVT